MMFQKQVIDVSVLYPAYYAESVDLLRGTLFMQAGNNSAPRRVAVRTMRMMQGQPVVTFEGVDDRSAAEVLRGQALLVPRSALPELPDDEAYLDDVMGFAIVDTASGKTLGTLEYAMFHTEPEVWAVKTPAGKEFYMPAAPEFIDDIDLDGEMIKVTLPEGLLEVYGITL